MNNPARNKPSGSLCSYHPNSFRSKYRRFVEIGGLQSTGRQGRVKILPLQRTKSVEFNVKQKLLSSLLAACSLLAVAATSSAATYNWNFTVTLSSANGGASTLLAWERTGDVYFAPYTNPNITSTKGTTVYARPDQAVVGTDAIPSLGYYVQHAVPSAGLYLKNYTKDITLSVDEIAFGSGGNPANMFSVIEFSTLSGTVDPLYNPNGWLRYSAGDSWGFVGDASGSVTLDQDFSVFQVGRWEDPVNGGLTTLIINGAAVPEPSASLLGLLGTALLFRRRRVA